MSRAAVADEILTAEEVARRLGLKVATVREWARLGRVPCLKPTTRTLRFRWSRLLASLEGGKKMLTRPRRRAKAG
jgi:excisionase family DNA binding protein